MSNVNIGAQWLISQIGNQQSYHHHKETMAWTAIAFYIPGIIVSGYAASGIFRDVSGKVGITFALLVTAVYLAGSFVYMQFYNRWEAANHVKGLIRAMSRLSSVTGTNKDICWEVKDNLWPCFVQQEICKARGESPRDIKRALWNWIRFRWDENEIDSRWLTEIPSYFAITLATVVSIILLWVN